MTPFSMTSSCMLGFQATQLVSYRLGLILIILCFLYDGKSQSISEENNSGLQNTTVADSTSGWKSLPKKIKQRKERRPELKQE